MGKLLLQQTLLTISGFSLSLSLYWSFACGDEVLQPPRPPKTAAFKRSRLSSPADVQ
jgi:hypothetical protein